MGIEIKQTTIDLGKPKNKKLKKFVTQWEKSGRISGTSKNGVQHIKLVGNMHRDLDPEVRDKLVATLKEKSNGAALLSFDLSHARFDSWGDEKFIDLLYTVLDAGKKVAIIVDPMRDFLFSAECESLLEAGKKIFHTTDPKLATKWLKAS